MHLKKYFNFPLKLSRKPGKFKRGPKAYGRTHISAVIRVSLPVFGKIFEAVMKAQMINFFDRNK